MMDNKWRTTQCPNCGGHGVVSDYGFSGRDFLGPKECEDCWGSGKLWIRPTGHCFAYPGGPARGMWSKEQYAKSTPVAQ